MHLQLQRKEIQKELSISYFLLTLTLRLLIGCEVRSRVDCNMLKILLVREGILVVGICWESNERKRPFNTWGELTLFVIQIVSKAKLVAKKNFTKAK